ncbi:protein of unknown function; putative exported protein [Methylorubrum extorquens DM4]|uniref:Uncharacterized protein n=1 Tax=Methylorubrum extorquens (strain DSM 6343 / CIP 106787 / DM4) TaxID=661410 RepID=C7CBK6_METED|nr:protein of unknown function; putative exported protein [Methylorubrum extorquens DM4]
MSANRSVLERPSSCLASCSAIWLGYPSRSASACDPCPPPRWARQASRRPAARVFWGRHKSAMASGLCLAITEMAARRSGGSLRQRNREDRPGLQAEIRWN